MEFKFDVPSNQSIPKSNGGNIINNQIQNDNINNNDIENNEQQLLDLAIKQSKEQENLEIERDKEEALMQLALYNSITEMKNINNEKVKEKEKTNEIGIKEEKEEEVFDEDYGICPIKLDYMKHPMLSPSGTYYEKSAIIDWIKKNQTDPMTREKLTIDMLVEDKEFAKKIKEYKKKFRKQIRKLKKTK